MHATSGTSTRFRPITSPLHAHPDLSLWRLRNQRPLGGSFVSPADAVHYPIALQAQEYDLPEGSLGQRVQAAMAASIEAALDAGTILRTHVLRPTGHFMLPKDICWVLGVTSPCVHGDGNGRT